MEIDKGTVVRVLRDISLLLELKGENSFKSRAYDIAADRIAGLTQNLQELVRQGKLHELPGIGEALEQKISELVTTGAMTYYESLRAEFPPKIMEMIRVPDLGPKRAARLWHELKIGDLTELERACLEGRIRGLKGFGEKSEQKILAGIVLVRRSGTTRFRLADAIPIGEQFLDRVKSVPGVVRASVGGSVRRFCETVSDLDIIASAPDAAPVLQAFAAFAEVAEQLGQGESKCSIRLKTGDLQVDLRVLPDEDFATALHHFTGSKAHHIRLRGRAQDRGLKISEWGIHRGQEKLPIESEADIYRLLDMQYVPPELREDWGEVEAAIEGRLPEDLITFEDVRGLVHSHSTWSDGRNTLQEMALAAQAVGLQYLTVTDHSQTASYAGGLKPDDLQRQWDEIDRLNASLSGIKLFKGVESDILEDGELDFEDRLLARCDIVIGSIHARHQMDEDQMTRRVVRAFDNPRLHVWGHPTGRLINSREPYGVRMEEILDAAVKRGVAIEVNGSPHRLDLKAEHVRMALRRGLKLVVSADSHSVAEVQNLRFAVGTARKGWARRGDVLNTLPAEQFSQALKELHSQ